MKGIAVPREPCLCLVDGGKDDIHWAERKRFYLASSGNQTLDELGIGHKSTYGIYQCMSIQVRRDFNPNDFRVSERGGLPTLTQTTPAKTEAKSKVKKHKKSKRKKRIKRLPTEDNKEEPTDGELRQLHFKAMEPVFNELYPKLKHIRDKLTALTLHKTPPKDRSKGIARAKENDLPGLANLSLNDTLNGGGKAGKIRYPILVGESANLYKTHQLLSGKGVTTLDLHGCTRDKARCILNESLYEWVDTAMRGEYPFVIAVDIICGSGKQVISELVAQFIRDNSQVANRPKGTC